MWFCFSRGERLHQIVLCRCTADIVWDVLALVNCNMLIWFVMCGLCTFMYASICPKGWRGLTLSFLAPFVICISFLALILNEFSTFWTGSGFQVKLLIICRLLSGLGATNIWSSSMQKEYRSILWTYNSRKLCSRDCNLWFVCSPFSVTEFLVLDGC